MKRFLTIIVFLILLTSCDHVIFLEPQPRKVKTIKRNTYLTSGDISGW